MARETMLVTGANRGIGLALVRKFVGHGWQVIACCRRPQEADELQQAAAEAADLVRIEKLDVTDPDQVAGLTAKLRDETIDILLNNAGVAGPGRQNFGQLDEAAWVEAFRVNTVGPLRMASSHHCHHGQHHGQHR
jgi:NAD(P)-dependent dehydrogenase (short-subunit alcohol dehydrogenase family)